MDPKCPRGPIFSQGVSLPVSRRNHMASCHSEGGRGRGSGIPVPSPDPHMYSMSIEDTAQSGSLPSLSVK